MSTKRQQTMAKMMREQALRERRAQKQEKKEAARSAKAGESTHSGAPGDDQASSGWCAIRTSSLKP